jgi:anti-sigma B factor antagonist
MQPKFRHDDGPDGVTRTLVPAGELDGAASADIRHRVESALASGKRRVIVDLSEVTYMETSTLSALMDANARVTRFGAHMCVVVPTDARVRLMFSITRLDKVLSVVDSREDALRLK